MIILRLDRIMVERKISLQELAEQVGITQANLSKIKNNKVNAIRFSTLNKICEVLYCQPGDLLEYEPETQTDPVLAEENVRTLARLHQKIEKLEPNSSSPLKKELV